MSSLAKRWLPLWVVPIVVILAIGTVWLRLAIIRTSYSVSQTDKMVRDLKQAKEQMELKVTALRSPRRLELLAKTRYGLGQPRSDQVIHYGRDNNTTHTRAK